MRPRQLFTVLQIMLLLPPSLSVNRTSVNSANIRDMSRMYGDDLSAKAALDTSSPLECQLAGKG